MIMTPKERLTEDLRSFFSIEEDERDYDKGALLLLQLTGNQIMYRNISYSAAKNARFINRELSKHYNVRLQQVTHEQVEQMQKRVDDIALRHLSLSEHNPASDFRKGKRADHDKLPAEIQALYVDNLGILQRMRDVQTRLRLLSEEGKICPDNDRYPYLKELIALDKQLHSNWERYDHYVVGDTAPKITADSKRLTTLINFAKGKYRKNPTEELKRQLKNWYGEIVNPSAKLTAELTDLGVI